MRFRPRFLSAGGGRRHSLPIAGRVAGVAVASVLAAAALGPAVAAPIITNGSFETPVVTPGTFKTYSTSTAHAITGWTIASGSVDLNGAGFWQAADGVQNVDLSGNNAGTIYQDVTLSSGFYDISYAMSGNPAGAPSLKTMNVLFGPSSGPLVIIEPATYDTTANGTTFANMHYQQHVDLTEITTPGSYRVEFQSTTAGGFGPVIDNVQMNATVPEPSSLAMMGLGGFALVAFRRRKSKKA